MPRLVYSSGPSGSGDAPSGPPGRAGESRAPARHDIHVRRETGGRRGKTVTTAAPLFVERAVADALSAKLKKLCGSGGTVVETTARDGAACLALEIQGDHVTKVVAALVAEGYRARAV